MHFPYARVSIVRVRPGQSKEPRKKAPMGQKSDMKRQMHEAVVVGAILDVGASVVYG